MDFKQNQTRDDIVLKLKACVSAGLGFVVRVLNKRGFQSSDAQILWPRLTTWLESAMSVAGMKRSEYSPPHLNALFDALLPFLKGFSSCMSLSSSVFNCGQSFADMGTNLAKFKELGLKDQDFDNFKVQIHPRQHWLWFPIRSNRF